MIDKSKYASHGTFIKRIDARFLGRRDKPRLAIINPEPTSRPRQPNIQSNEPMTVESKKIDAKFKYQEVKAKPVPQDLIKPFLYIERVLRPKKANEAVTKPRVKPLVRRPADAPISRVPKRPAPPQIEVPTGYSSLYEYEADRQTTADRLFQRLL